MRPRAYIIGPITGIPDGNRPAFEIARQLLRRRGYLPIVPLDLTRDIVAAYRCPAMVWCLAMLRTRPVLLSADVVYLLPDWYRSRGACDEWRRATEAGIELREITEDELASATTSSASAGTRRAQAPAGDSDS